MVPEQTCANAAPGAAKSRSAAISNASAGCRAIPDRDLDGRRSTVADPQSKQEYCVETETPADSLRLCCPFARAALSVHRSFDLVAVWIAHEAAVVAIAVVPTRAGRASVAAARRNGCLVEGLHCVLGVGEEADVDAVCNAGRLAVGRSLHPELGELLAVGDGSREVEDALAAEDSEYAVIELGRAREVVGANRNVRDRAGVFVAHGCTS